MECARFRALALAGAGALVALAACNQVLGIEGASVDPRLSVGVAASAGSAAMNISATGGTGASAAGGTLGLSTGGASTTSGGGSGEQPRGGGPSSDGGEGGETHAVPATGGASATGGSSATGGDDHGHGTSDDAGAAGAPSGPVDLCDEYCDILDAVCTSNAEQYRDRDQCMTICHLLPQGTVGGPDDDSVACRLKYAQKTRYTNGEETAEYCREAGPGGDNRCGTVCEGYCTLMAQVCTEQSAGVYHFASNDDCMATCNGLPQATVPYSDTDPMVSDGNHALCRLFHVASAAMADTDEHCEHAMGVTLCEAPSQ